jgi:hypothetical protein
MYLDRDNCDEVLTLEAFGRRAAEDWRTEFVSAEVSCGVDVDVMFREQDGSRFTHTYSPTDMADMLGHAACRLARDGGEDVVVCFD